MTKTIVVSLEDDDMGDYFVVRVTEDPVYGTPVFTTMGGQSKCPGETGTNRRESQISNFKIVSRCTANDPTQACTSGATFGAQILNMSPTRDPGYYLMNFQPAFSAAVNSFDCSNPLVNTGWSLAVQNLNVQYIIPYGKSIEIPFGFDNGLAGASMIRECNSFSGLTVNLIAACENPTPNSQVFQYGNTINAQGVPSVSFLAKDRLYAYNVTATVPDFSFGTTYTRKLSEISSENELPTVKGVSDGVHKVDGELRVVIYVVIIATLVLLAALFVAAWLIRDAILKTAVSHGGNSQHV